MNTFIAVNFWLGVTLFFVRILFLAFITFPHPRKPLGIGEVVASTLLGLGFTIWAGLLLFGK